MKTTKISSNLTFKAISPNTQKVINEITNNYMKEVFKTGELTDSFVKSAKALDEEAKISLLTKITKRVFPDDNKLYFERPVFIRKFAEMLNINPNKIKTE